MTRSPRCITVAALVAASAGLAGCGLHKSSSSTAATAAAESQSSALLSPTPYRSAGQSAGPWPSASRTSSTVVTSSSTTRASVASKRPAARRPVAGPAPATASTPNAAALAGVKAIESSDTTVDDDPHDTVQRASAWLTPAFAAQVKAFPPVAAPGATWNAWAAHRAYVTVTTSLGGDEHPTDTATTAYRQVIAVRMERRGRDRRRVGVTGPHRPAVALGQRSVQLVPPHTQEVR